MQRFAGLGKQGNLGRVAVAARWLALSLCLTALLTGCTRKFFRKQADKEVDHVLAEYPRPQLRRAEWLNLNGMWQFAEAHEGVCPAPYERVFIVSASKC